MLQRQLPGVLQREHELFIPPRKKILNPLQDQSPLFWMMRIVLGGASLKQPAIHRRGCNHLGAVGRSLRNTSLGQWRGGPPRRPRRSSEKGERKEFFWKRGWLGLSLIPLHLTILNKGWEVGAKLRAPCLAVHLRHALGRSQSTGRSRVLSGQPQLSWWQEPVSRLPAFGPREHGEAPD